MSEAAAVAAALLDGLRFAVAYNPMTAVMSAALAAGLTGAPRMHPERSRWAVPVLAAGWLLGDGLRVLGRSRDVYDGVGGALEAGASTSAPAWAIWVVLGVWALGSLAIGYVVPALVGAAVGRRVTHGTGWLAAAAIASALVLVVSAAAGALG